MSGYVSFSGMPLSLSRASPTISTGQQIRQWVRDRLWRTYSAVCLELFSPLVIISDERLQVNPENLAVLYLFPQSKGVNFALFPIDYSIQCYFVTPMTFWRYQLHCLFFLFLVTPWYSKDYIIDMCSVERNQILVKTYLVGGTSERNVPGRTLTEVRVGEEIFHRLRAVSLFS